MNTAVADLHPATRRTPQPPSATAASDVINDLSFAPDRATHVAPVAADVVLLGTGTVGEAVLRRLAERAASGARPALRLHAVCNSRSRYVAGRTGWHRHGDAGEPASRVEAVQALLRALPVPAVAAANASGAVGAANPDPSVDTDADTFALEDWCAPTSPATDHRLVSPRILIDATASDAIAERHARWLAQGVHVVTACKLGQGTSLARWHAIHDAQSLGGTRYGDAATVGAGLPLLASVRALREGGDRIHAIAGVLSGSLAWLFHNYDGLRPFSGFVRTAREAGYTEPDPREDLGGEDVRRKLLILARAAGAALSPEQVAVESLVPPALAALPVARLDAALPQLDAPLRTRFASARRNGECLRFVARLELPADGPPRARIGLESLPFDDPLAGGAGTDNRVAIYSDRYRERPLLIQGPGAGADVTAAALIDDVLTVLRLAVLGPTR